MTVIPSSHPYLFCLFPLPTPSIDNLDPSAIAKELATGKASVHDKLDRFGRPVVLIQVKQHVIGAWEYDWQYIIYTGAIIMCIGIVYTCTCV